MKDTELKILLETYNRQLESAQILNLQSWVLNLKCFESLQAQKAQSKLNSLVRFKTFAVFLGIVWVLFLGYLISQSLEMDKIFFIISTGAILIFTLIAIGMYIYHIVLLKNVNNGEPVIKTQDTIARLQLSTLKVTCLLFLQTPFYCTFWWNMDMIIHSPYSFWFISFPIAVLFTLASLWLYKNISFKNEHKKWFKILFNSPEWNNLSEANAFLDEIHKFKNA